MTTRKRAARLRELAIHERAGLAAVRQRHDGQPPRPAEVRGGSRKGRPPAGRTPDSETFSPEGVRLPGPSR